MARRPFIYLAGNLSGWPFGTTPNPRLLRNLDQFSSELVNGEDGGTWAPTDPIVIGPCGTPSMTLSSAGCVFSGDVETAKGNDSYTEVDAIPGIVLQTTGGGPVFQTARTRTVVVPFSNWSEAQPPFSAALGVRYRLDPETMGARTVDAPPSGSNLPTFVPFPVRAQHRGSTISRIDFRYKIGKLPLAIGGALGPGFRAVKITGETIAPLHTLTGAYSFDGWAFDASATTSDYYSQGNVKVLSYFPNQNHTSLDPSGSHYGFQWLDNDSNAAPNIFLSATVTLTGIADMRPE